jgi:hypothetical protein
MKLVMFPHITKTPTLDATYQQIWEREQSHPLSKITELRDVITIVPQGHCAYQLCKTCYPEDVVWVLGCKKLLGRKTDPIEEEIEEELCSAIYKDTGDPWCSVIRKNTSDPWFGPKMRYTIAPHNSWPVILMSRLHSPWAYEALQQLVPSMDLEYYYEWPTKLFTGYSIEPKLFGLVFEKCAVAKMWMEVMQRPEKHAVEQQSAQRLVQYAKVLPPTESETTQEWLTRVLPPKFTLG